MLTITEALAELKTNIARRKKKAETLIPYVARDGRLKDPFVAEGGAANWIARERQGIGDLETRFVRIRTAIQQANLTNKLTVCGMTASVAEWLTWRREIAQSQRANLNNLGVCIQKARQTGQLQGRTVSASAETADLLDIVVNVNEAALAKEQETLEQMLGELDGKLSLFNATMTIEVD